MSGYIGTAPVPQSTQTRETFTATAGQTTFNTGGYTAGYIDVFLNGVKLVSGTDYTATNGSDVVLLTGASAGDTLETVAYTAFTVADQDFTGTTTTQNLTVTGAFTSQGIDDNATSTAMTLDASGNLLVGKTTIDSTVQGLTLSGQYNLAAFTRDQNPPLLLNRLTSDGMIAEFRKDGTTVGSISVSDGDRLNLNSGVMGIKLYDDTKTILPSNGSGSNADAQVTLGGSTVRFKNLYLSGGVYLGGTGSANKLDDYEEGNWYPSITGVTVSGGTFEGFYTKKGNEVTVWFRMENCTISGTGNVITGLPFTVLTRSTTSAPALYITQTGTNLLQA